MSCAHALAGCADHGAGLLCKQVREAEEQGLILRSAMTCCTGLGFLAFASGAFVGILDLPMFAADASSAWHLLLHFDLSKSAAVLSLYDQLAV